MTSNGLVALKDRKFVLYRSLIYSCFHAGLGNNPDEFFYTFRGEMKPIQFLKTKNTLNEEILFPKTIEIYVLIIKRPGTHNKKK